MKKFVIGVCTGLLLAFLTGVVIVFSAFRLGERRPTIPEGATLLLNLSDDLPEKQPVRIPTTVRGIRRYAHGARHLARSSQRRDRFTREGGDPRELAE